MNMKTAENIEFHLYNIAMCACPQPDFGSFAEESIYRKTLYGFLSRKMHFCQYGPVHLILFVNGVFSLVCRWLTR